MAKSKLTPKENYLRLTRGELPEYIPVYTMGFPGYNNETAVKMLGPSLLDETHITPAPTGRTDVWGVKYIANEETNFACIPEPNNFILEDVTKWRDVIKRPQLPEHIDWAQLARRDMEKAGIDRSQTAGMGVIGLMPFQQLIAFMGFTNGLMALFEEPECVKELLNFMVDVYMPVVQATVDYYAPDIVYLLDDTATNHNPFISTEMYRDILKPVYARLTKPAVERGIPVQFHNCGRCEDFIDDMLDFGVKIWDPAQQTNDLDGIRKKYAGKLALAGCYKWVPPSTWPDVNEAAIRQTVRDCVDRFAPGGGFAFSGAALGRYGDKTIAQVNRWIADEAYHYGRDYYLQ
ncbi:Uroporphyrinogen-III decarboxylase [Sporobacter termitidis DSM 10068]|uniref:Uroporphyrinogen-III decarboxylase n=1 Tax=Sporobacter termitidis DSM 10068 TaxID=1123282 RepID=A0A1M5XLI7_9FIRM|nr:uroporphyrinogen decarboxylase family protein [Sporobacter termitidis]SHI00123.1 Uroporphyrinogen-III decarboxylase [Sporobacter termitidis DSM 10068]